MGSLSSVGEISKRAEELIQEGMPITMAIDKAYNEIMKGSREDEVKRISEFEQKNIR